MIRSYRISSRRHAAPKRPSWQPSTDDFAQVFAEQNPWRTSGEVPRLFAPLQQRPLAKWLFRAMLRPTPRRYYLIVGPRRVGKSTCMYQTVEHLLAAGGGTAATMVVAARSSAADGVVAGPADALHRAVERGHGGRARLRVPRRDHVRPHWDRWLKTFYDDGWPVQIAASSSATAMLRNQSHESGVGRWDQLYLPPYSFPEYLDLLGNGLDIPAEATLNESLRAVASDPPVRPDLQPALRRFLLTGGFPELLLAGGELGAGEESDFFLQAQGRLRDGAVIRAIYQDIPQAFGIDNPMLLERLLYSLGGQITGVLSPSKIAGALGMSAPTFDKYLSYLEQAFLVFTTTNYGRVELNVQKRGRKLYFVDGAVRNAALQRDPQPLANPEEYGLLLENVVASHLHALAQLRQVRLHHWREDNLAEVDMILEEPSAPLAIEVGRGAGHHRRGLTALAERHGVFERDRYFVAPVIASTPAGATGDGIGSVPLDLFLLVVGAQAQSALRVRLGVSR
ncbi:ATP-binding protein [Nannocystis pusilla]|uniref:ATP-binding protein n=1 Tax=Nannocystis pusilla TaxID=889268 RepID=A0A9X3J2U9_9BACT|nr:ATP-binding protein [Nannocystis pusilla]MCY1012550.1 ATP-binding protein [Nannocystis pusilla]